MLPDQHTIAAAFWDARFGVVLICTDEQGEIYYLRTDCDDPAPEYLQRVRDHLERYFAAPHGMN